MVERGGETEGGSGPDSGEQSGELMPSGREEDEEEEEVVVSEEEEKEEGVVVAVVARGGKRRPLGNVCVSDVDSIASIKWERILPRRIASLYGKRGYCNRWRRWLRMPIYAERREREIERKGENNVLSQFSISLLVSAMFCMWVTARKKRSFSLSKVDVHAKNDGNAACQ